jgi:hypothetical protein
VNSSYLPIVSLLFGMLYQIWAPASALAQTDTPIIGGVTPSSATLNTTLVITINHWPKEPKFDTSRWILCLDGIPFDGIAPDNKVPVLKNDGNAQFFFHLHRSPSSETAWNKLVRRMGRDGVTRIGIGTTTGLEGGLNQGNVSLNLNLLAGWKGAVTVWIPIGVAILLVVLGLSTKMLRLPNGRFSLGRTQMAWWFVIILWAYLYIGFITGNFGSSINDTCLVLMGISAGTALGAQVIDSAFAAEAARTSRTAYASATSRGIVQDLISTNDGISLHRFQNLVWTIVFGVVFICGVIEAVAMPVFSATLLTLMGISNGTYLGFKFPTERPK